MSMILKWTKCRSCVCLCISNSSGFSLPAEGGTVQLSTPALLLLPFHPHQRHTPAWCPMPPPERPWDMRIRPDVKHSWPAPVSCRCTWPTSGVTGNRKLRNHQAIVGSYWQSYTWRWIKIEAKLCYKEFNYRSSISVRILIWLVNGKNNFIAIELMQF